MSSNNSPPNKNYPDDGRLVGSDAIFFSPNVTPPPTSSLTSREVIPLPPADDGIPTPSIYYDDRGEIHNIKVNEAYRVNILYTRAGHLRSGDLHPNIQCDFIFSGKVKVWTLGVDGYTDIRTYEKHSLIKIPRGVPHVFEFVEDTVMAEWWEPQGFQAWFYKPYRDIVNKCMSVLSGDKTKHKRGLVILKPCNGWRDKSKLIIGAAVFGVAGFVVGCRFGHGQNRR